MPSRLDPYLSLRDNAREAIQVCRVFGGELRHDHLQGVQRLTGPAKDDRVMHGMLEAPNGMVLMGADAPSSMEYWPEAT